MSLINKTSNLDIYTALTETALELPYAEGGIAAGFPSPAEDFIENGIDLNQVLIENKFSTFFGRVKGNSMKDLGIQNGDIMIIDKSIEPKDGKIAVCYIDGEFTVKTIKIEKDAIYLIPANKDFKTTKVTSENEFIIWGIVTYVIKSFK